MAKRDDIEFAIMEFCRAIGFKFDADAPSHVEALRFALKSARKR